MGQIIIASSCLFVEHMTRLAYGVQEELICQFGREEKPKLMDSKVTKSR